MAVDRLREWIAGSGLTPGSALPSVRDLAAMIGQSRFSTHQALLQLERDGFLRMMPGKVRIIVDGAGTSLPSVRGKVLLVSAFVSTRDLDLGDWRSWQQQMFQGVRAAAMADGVELAVLPINPESLRRFDRLVLDRPAGFIFLEDVVNSDEGRRLLAAAMASGLPVAAYGDVFPVADLPRLNADLVSGDQRGGAAALVGWLAARGRRRLLPWVGPSVRSGSALPGLQWYGERLAGYREGCAAHGLELLPPVPLLSGTGHAETPATFAEVVRLQVGSLLAVIDPQRPTDAIAALSDGLAYEAAAAVRLLGREPGRDLDIVGYDNCWSWCPQRAFVGSGLGATIEVDWTGIGRTLIGMLTARLAGRAGTTPVRSVVPARLVVPDERAG